MRDRITASLTRALIWTATNGPVAWAASWHSRVWSALLFEQQHKEPTTLRAVLPWDTSSAPHDALAIDNARRERAGFPRITESGLPDQFGDEAKRSKPKLK